MKYQNVIKRLNRLFPDDSPPEKITKCSTKNNLVNDFECMSVENDFAKRNRNSLSYADCSMPIIDSALITDEAFILYQD